MVDEREKKLPKWAQDELERLRQNVAYHKTRALSATSLHGALTDTRVRELGGKRHGLPPGTRVEFGTQEQVQQEEAVTVFRDDNGDINITALAQLMVKPWSTNQIIVKVVPYNV